LTLLPPLIPTFQIECVLHSCYSFLVEIFFLFVELGLKLKASHFLGRHYTL
jgi:hypothetical protein